MRLKLWLNVLLIVSNGNLVFAQTNKTWQLGRTLQITFTDSANYQIQTNPLNDIKQYRFFSRPNGSLCIPHASSGSTQSTCYVMDSSYKLIQPQPYLLGYDYYNYSCLFPTGFDSFTSFSHFRFENYYNCIDFQKNLMDGNSNINICDFNGKYGLYSKNFIFHKNKPEMVEDIKLILPLSGNNYPPNIRRLKNFNYGGVRIHSIQNQIIGFYSYLIGRNYSQCVDSFLWNLEYLLPPQYRDSNVFKTTYSTDVIANNNDLSPGCTKFACKVQINSKLKFHEDAKSYFAEYIVIIDLNELTFHDTPELILVDKGETSKIPDDIIGPAPAGILVSYFAFSPNGQTLFAVLTHQKSNSTNNFSSLVTYRKIGDKWQRNDSLFSFNRIYPYFLNPYGGLTVYAYDRNKNNYRIINYPVANNPLNPSIQEVNPFQGLFTATTHHPYDYLRFDHYIKFKDCGAYLNFSNRSDESFGIDTYEWWISKNKAPNEVEYYKGRVPPPVFFKEDGVYFVKVHGTNSLDSNGYAEWWWDSIKVSIPAKPKAAFTANPLRNCLGSQVDFNNTSNQGQLNPSTPINYFWHFGDGDTSNMSFPKHTYKAPGLYDITLVINNGYCSDTLIQKKYISVVDAPQSGFTLNKNEGCTPFEITFLETNNRPVISRQYILGDGSVVFPDTSIFNHTYLHKGRYTVHQLLLSASGCEAKDSAVIIVHRGFTDVDSCNTYICTYIDNKNINLTWLEVPDAHSYNLYGGIYFPDKLITTLPASVQSFNTEIQEPAPYSFKVIALDSCGNESKAGRFGVPIFLDYSQDANRSINLNYTAYKNWEVPVIKYEIYFMPIMGSLIGSSIKDNGIALNYSDYDFAKSERKLEDTMRCYIIKATGLDGRASWSNSVCAKLQPEVYLPAAFTPDENGLNDIYAPLVLGFRNYDLSIFNSWGQKISQTRNSGWNAKYVASGVYVAVFVGTDVHGRTINLTQTIHLLR